MNFVALKMLVGDRLKYLGLVGGLAFAALLVTQQASIFTGYALRTGAWIRDTSSADLWIMDPQQEHTDDQKRMISTSLQRIRSVDGVDWAVPMFKGYMPARLADGRVHQIRVVGLDDATLEGAPPGMQVGSLADLRSDRAVFINRTDTDKKLALRSADGTTRPLTVGDRIDINDHDTVVAGIYTKSSEFFWEPVIYTTYSRALRIAPPERKQLQFVLAKLRPGADVAAVQKQITDTTGLAAYTRDQFESITMWFILIQTGILINFGITIALGFVIGVLVSALLLYTFMLEHSRHFAALKAMGASSWRLIRMVGLQVLIVGAAGFGIGIGGAAITGKFFAGGDLAFAMVWQIPVFGAAAILCCCFVAGALSLVRVLRLEPGIVFKS
jgi:putative ABC transport system permease protein